MKKGNVDFTQTIVSHSLLSAKAPIHCEIYLVRHADPQSHEQLGGLTAAGREQAARIANFLSHALDESDAALVVVSPTLRTRETADPIALALHVRPLVHSAFSEAYLVDTHINFTSPSFIKKNVQIRTIMKSFWEVVHNNLTRKIIIVTHGNVIRAIVGSLCKQTCLGMSKIEVPLGCVVPITIRDGVVTIHNCIADD